MLFSTPSRDYEASFLLHWLTCSVLFYCYSVWIWVRPEAAVGWSWVSLLLAVAILAGRRIVTKAQTAVDFIPTRMLRVYDKVAMSVYSKTSPLMELPLLWLMGKSRALLKFAASSELALLRSDIEEVLNQYSEPVPEPTPPATPTGSAPISFSPSKPVPATKEFSWKINVPVLVKKASGGAPALYFPHIVWFEPDTKRLYWQASGDDICSCDVVSGVKVMNKVALTLNVMLTANDAAKTLKFKDATLFRVWYERLAAAIGQVD